MLQYNSKRLTERFTLPDLNVLIELLEEWEKSHSPSIDSRIEEEAYLITIWYNCTPTTQEVIDVLAELQAIKFVYPHLDKHLVIHIT